MFRHSSTGDGVRACMILDGLPIRPQQLFVLNANSQPRVKTSARKQHKRINYQFVSVCVCVLPSSFSIQSHSATATHRKRWSQAKTIDPDYP